jgi:hypothetical protein
VGKPEWKIDHLGDQNIDMRIIPKGSVRNRVNGLEWNDVTQDRNQFRDLVNTVMNLRVP